MFHFGEDLSGEWDGWVGSRDQREELPCGCSVNSLHPFVDTSKSDAKIRLVDLSTTFSRNSLYLPGFRDRDAIRTLEKNNQGLVSAIVKSGGHLSDPSLEQELW